jgi:hypothetical protein
MRMVQQRVMNRDPGTPGVFALLADRSTSMSYRSIYETNEAIPGFKRAFPGLRGFAFHAGLAEATYRAGNPCEEMAHVLVEHGNSKGDKRYKR